jgi:hypothetical protein
VENDKQTRRCLIHQLKNQIYISFHSRKNDNAMKLDELKKHFYILKL